MMTVAAFKLPIYSCQAVFSRSDPSERGYWEDVPETTVKETRSWLLSEETRSLLLSVSLRIRWKDSWPLEKAMARREELVRERLH